MIKVKFKVETKKSQAEQFIELMSKYPDAHVTVGIHEGAGSYQSKGKKAAPSVVQVALWNEFGTPDAKHPIPERSFIRSAIDDNMPLIEKWRLSLISQMLSGKKTMNEALETMGYRVQTLIENKIKSNIPPENAPSTAEAKIRDGVAPETLIHTGLLLRSVTYQVNL